MNVSAAPAPVTRRRTPALGAFLEGWRRALAAPVVTISLVGATLVAGLPVAGLLGVPLRPYLGAEPATRAEPSLSARFAAETADLGYTFAYEALGAGGTLSGLGYLLRLRDLDAPMAAALATYLALSMFLSGGALDRLARGRPIRTAAFFAASGVNFFRFLRLAIVIGAAYWLIWAGLQSWQAELWARIALWAGLGIVTIVADFARVRIVVEDRRSALGALAASFRFVRQRPFRVVALYLLNGLVLLALLRLWFQAAPAALAPRWVVLLLGLTYLLCRIWARLAFLAGEVTFFQGELAHAGYTAAPPLRWPDSPAVEAIENLTRR